MNTLVELLETSARDYQGDPAALMRIGVRSIRYTYSGLELRAHAYARLMQSRRVNKGDRVVIWAANQPDWLAAMFGTFLVGGVLVPLDVRSSREFVERVVAQTEPVLGFAGSQQASVLRGLEVPTLELETLDVPVNGKITPVPLDRDDLAEIIFTSGTTGDPKGVMLSHYNIASNVTAALQVIPINRQTRMLSLLPLSHMFEQIGGCFALLQVGGAVLYPASRQPVSLVRNMQSWKPTIIIGVPQLLALFMNAVEREAASRGRLRLLERLRAIARRLPERGRRLLFRSVLQRFGGEIDFLVSGGAALPYELQQKWEAMGVAVVEGYGTTECAPVISASPRHARRPRSVGITLPGQQIRIAEDGEVQARGPNVFKGYWNNPAATEAAFDDGWYRTGDVGYMSDGYLYLKGRKKDLIVLPDGQNVYPEDVEEALSRQPGVRDAVVIGLEREEGTRVHAVILEETPGVAAEAVRGANAILDDRQQIMGFTVWPGDDFPRTHTLKVRKNLVLSYVQDQQVSPDTPPPAAVDTDSLRRLIAQCGRIADDVREDQQLGVDLGLDSLARVELLSAIEEEIGVYVDDTEVGPQTKVSELRAMIETSERPPRQHRFPKWPRRRAVRLLRRAIVTGLIFPVLRLPYKVEVRGRHRFKTLEEPCLIVSNHNMHLDAAMLLKSMPHRFRQRVAIAAAASDIYGNRARGFGASLLGNAFPFSKEGSGVRESLEHVVEMLEEGWNVLIFPEGRLTVIGPMQPFKSGTGLLAVESGVPVLPMRIDVLRPGFYEGKWLPHPRARVRVNVGEPLRFEPGTSYADATRRLQKAVREA
ncbi:MAG TPA: AMP-binding protein [Tepidiformaceae bacterium]